MKTDSKRINVSGAALLAAACALGGNAFAQTMDDSQNLPRPATDAASCNDVNWNTRLLGDYPWVSRACHEVVDAEGARWARFEADFAQVNSDGTITADFRGPQGQRAGSVQLQPGDGQTVSLDGRPYEFSELRRGQSLNFYVPEGVYGFTSEPTQRSPQLTARSTSEDRSTTQRQTTQSQQPDRSTRMAQAEPRQQQRASELPRTAGPVPLLALGGGLSLLAGLGLSLRRRRR